MHYHLHLPNRTLYLAGRKQAGKSFAAHAMIESLLDYQNVLVVSDIEGFYSLNMLKSDRLHFLPLDENNPTLRGNRAIKNFDSIFFLLNCVMATPSHVYLWRKPGATVEELCRNLRDGQSHVPRVIATCEFMSDIDQVAVG